MRRAQSSGEPCSRELQLLLDAGEMLERAAPEPRDALRMLSPALFDWAIATWVGEDRAPRVFAYHHDPRRDAGLSGIASVDLLRSVSDEMARAEAPLLLEGDDLRSLHLDDVDLSHAIVVPVRTHERTAGILLLGRDSRASSLPHPSTAETLGRRLAAALECERELREARAAVRARERLLAMVSHELRAPLSTIVVSATTVSRGATRDDGAAQVREAGERILRCARRMERLIGDLLDFSQLEEGTMRIERSPELVAPLVRHAIDLARPLARGVQLTSSIPEDVENVSVLCDRERVLEILANLVGNAIKLTPSGGHVVVTVELAGHEVLVSVRDSGPGVSPEELPYIFEAYKRGPQRGTDGPVRGVGLGLYIARGLVQAHGGRIWAESDARGGTFAFTLPLAGRAE